MTAHAGSLAEDMERTPDSAAAGPVLWKPLVGYGTISEKSYRRLARAITASRRSNGAVRLHE